jgi:hypothetical protein
MFKSYLVLIAFIFFGALLKAQSSYYFPQVFFDAKQAEFMIAAGTSTIEGVAFTKVKGKGLIGAIAPKKQYATYGTKVSLFPCTDYFNTWYKLYKAYSDKNTGIFMSADAFSYRLEVGTDEYGRFKFENIKPGKYYLETVIPYAVQKSYSEKVGQTDYYMQGGGFMYSTPQYQTYFYNQYLSSRESVFVEVTRDGQLVEVKLN